MKYLLVVLVFMSVFSCKKPEIKKGRKLVDPVNIESDRNVQPDVNEYDMVELTEEEGFILDIRYATDNNFTKKVIYGCPKCFLHKSMYTELKKAQKIFQEEYGLSIKLFDCYRPRPAQERLWFIVSDPRYVSPPGQGSMHNRGLAVDLTLVDETGQELDMGTGFDFFGEEAHTDNTSLAQQVLDNRKILSETLELFNIKGIRTEWWHFSLRTDGVPLSDWEWSCD